MTVYSSCVTHWRFTSKFVKRRVKHTNMIQSAYGDNVTNRSDVFEFHVVSWRKRTGRGRSMLRTLFDDQSVNFELSNFWTMIADRACGRYLPTITVHEIATENWGMKKVCAKSLPNMFADEQKDKRFRNSLIAFVTIRNFSENRITGTSYGDQWVWYGEQMLRTAQLDLASLHKNLGRASRKWNPCRLSFFYSKRVARKEFLPPGQTLNATILRGSVLNIAKTSRSRPPREAWKLHNDVARRNAFAVTVCLAKNRVSTFPWPPHGPDVILLDLPLLFRLKRVIKGRYHCSV